MYSFIACSHRLGKLRVVSPSGDIRILTATGTWEKEDDAEYWKEQLYPVYCNAEKKFKQQKAVFDASPTIDQMKQKPKEDYHA